MIIEVTDRAGNKMLVNLDHVKYIFQLKDRGELAGSRIVFEKELLVEVCENVLEIKKL